MNTPRSHRLYEHGARLGQVEVERDNFSKALGEAMTENTNLRETNVELLAALELISSPMVGKPVGDPFAFYRDLQAIARAAITKARSVK